MFNMTPAFRAVALTAVTLAASTSLLTIEASARGGNNGGNHGMSNMGGMRSSMQFRPIVRDHRTVVPARVVVRDHRAPKVVSGPIIRDHRKPVVASGPIIRDHRTPVASNGPIVRDHRGDGPTVRDHRGDSATAPGGVPVRPTPGGPVRPPVVDTSGAPGGVTVTPTSGNPRPPALPPVVSNPPVVSPPTGPVRPPSVHPQPMPPVVADPRPPSGPGIIIDPCRGDGCGHQHPPRPAHPHHFSGGPAVILATTVIDDGCIYEWRNRYAANGSPIAYKVKICPMLEDVR